MTLIDPTLAETVAAYRTCEFATLGKDGSPVAWPTAAWLREDGTLLVTTSLAFAQKALNVRRDPRVALLFSDPTGSGRPDADQVLITGTADCPDEIMAGPDGAEEYWRTLFRRQPHSRGYVGAPGRWFMDWYYLRLLITVTPTQVRVRPPLSDLLAPGRSGTDVPAPADGGAPIGADLVGRFPTAVLAACDPTGAPLLARTRVAATEGGFAMDPVADLRVAPGPAGLLVHRHDDRLSGMHNALVRGELRSEGERWLLAPGRVVEPAGSGSLRDNLRTLSTARKATARYLDRRSLPRPRVAWDRFADLAAQSRD
ncbi:pyridoxamine 5'-phosphate oxidase family protein [Kitasatospora sp. NPDC059571]|uniref:pyridoxamine 5'-phosphate oxidase family protein n=1 Tax=Kitasatospora sp. NPDC059571 TaxID=3346871 RepID=UPI003679402C